MSMSALLIASLCTIIGVAEFRTYNGTDCDSTKRIDDSSSSFTGGCTTMDTHLSIEYMCKTGTSLELDSVHYLEK
jgi:hypothetical protein